MTGLKTGIQNARYCRCGNVKILVGVGSTSEIHLRFAFLAELRNKVLRCRCCDTNVAQADGIESIADIDKVTAVTIIDAIDERQLRAQPTYSDVFQMVIPTINNSDNTFSTDFPPEIQLTLDTATQRQRNVTQAQIAEFRTTKQQEFKSWREQARKQATIIARIAETATKAHTSSAFDPSVTITQNQPILTPNGSELFPKSPVTQYAHPGASPLAAASLTRSHSEQPSISPPLAKITPPPIPLSSSLKSPASTSMSKPVKRVMFQEPPDDEVHSDVEEETQIDIPAPPTGDPIISVDDEMFDFDETIPGVAVESDSTGSRSSSSPDSPVQPVRSPLFAPPLSPFRRRSIEKYDLPDDEDPFDDPSHGTKANGVQREEKIHEELPALSSSRPIAITPPSRSFLAEGLGVDEEEDEGGIKGLIERISLKNTRSGPRASFADQKMLWDIPGDYYRSVTS